MLGIVASKHRVPHTNDAINTSSDTGNLCVNPRASSNNRCIYKLFVYYACQLKKTIHKLIYNIVAYIYNLLEYVYILSQDKQICIYNNLYGTYTFEQLHIHISWLNYGYIKTHASPITQHDSTCFNMININECLL